MLYVLPVAASDINIFKPLVDVIVRLGRMSNHSILVIPTPEVLDEATRIAAPLHDLCQTRIIATHENHTGSWPWACNKMWVAAIEIILQNHNGPWTWLEADCCPVVENWADLWATEYNVNGKPCMGHLRHTDEVMVGAEGRHQIGAGAYNTQMWRDQQWWRSLVNVQNEPFDIVLRHWISNISTDTKLFHHAYASYDYKRSATGFHYAASILDENRKKAREIQGVVPQGTVIVHGCKDGSLAKLILAPSSSVSVASVFEEGPGEHPFNPGGTRSVVPIEPPFSPIADPAKVREALGEPSTKMAKSAEYRALLHALQNWNIESPALYSGLSQITGSHVKFILDTIEQSRKQEVSSAPLCQADYDNAKRIARIVNANPTGKAMKRRPILDELEITLPQLLSAAKVPGAEFSLSSGPALYVIPLKPNTVQPRKIKSIQSI